MEKLADRVGIIINGRMVQCDSFAAMTAEKCLEDVFFDTYVKEVGTDEK